MTPPTPPTATASHAPFDSWTDLERRVRSLEMQRAYLIGGLLAFAAVFGALGFNAFSYIDDQVRKQIPLIVEQRAKQVAQETIKAELPAQVTPAVEQSVRRQFQEQRAAWNQSIDERVAAALPALQLQSAVRELGGTVVKGPNFEIFEIDLSGHPVTKEQLERLGAFQAIDKVKVLGLQKSFVEPDALRALEAWPGLEQVDVAKEAASEELRAALPPKVKVEVDGKL